MNYNKTLFWISIVFYLSFIVLFCCRWKNTNDEISEIKKDNQEFFCKIQEQKTYGPFVIETKELNKKQVIIESKEIEKINNHINNLSEKVYEEYHRAERIINNDIDRLNTYMAIGIGFMTLLGVFVPILINILNHQDLREKQKRLTEELECLKISIRDIPTQEIETAKTNSETAIEKSNEALQKSEQVDNLTNKIENIDTAIRESFPKISTLILQSAIVRYFNLVPYLLGSKQEDSTHFKDLIGQIKNGFSGCNSENTISILSDTYYKSIIMDFIKYIENPRNYTSFINKKTTSLFFELPEILNQFLSSISIEEENSNCVRITNKLDEIINSIDNINVTTEPTIKPC